jgi:hypothetical protein
MTTLRKNTAAQVVKNNSQFRSGHEFQPARAL